MPKKNTEFSHCEVVKGMKVSEWLRVKQEEKTKGRLSIKQNVKLKAI